MEGQSSMLMEQNENSSAKKYHPCRFISSFELSDKLRDLAKTGVNVPQFNHSINMPKFIGMQGDVELYSGGIEVKPGQVVDSHGNVVDLATLEQERVKLLSKGSKDFPSYL